MYSEKKLRAIDPLYLGYEWTIWLDSDDPVDTGDWENRAGFPVSVVCAVPTAIEAQVNYYQVITLTIIIKDPLILFIN